MLTCTPIDHRDTWNTALAALPYAHILQSWEWGDFKSRWGWQPTRLLWRQGETPVAAAQMLAKAIPRTPWHFLYAAKGPALDYADTSLTTHILADLAQYARQQRAIFLKIDPDVVRQYGEPGEQPPEAVGQAVLELLAGQDWRFSPEQIQFRNTVLLDVRGEPEEWLARMKPKWRYNIRLAERKGVAIRAGTEADLPAFFRMYAETAARDGFLIRPEAYYREVWQQFLAARQAELLLAEVDGQPVAGLALFFLGRRAWYIYGASTGQHRALMPNHLLQFSAMQRASALGCTHYDLWGAPDVFDDSDRMLGVYRFKQGFGGETVLGLGAFDFPARPALYRLFTETMPRARALLRRLRRHPAE
jgi:lipid II:glycine glycyltransferase (peptidoglycan interpeptide bridge formation enzyme)